MPTITSPRDLFVLELRSMLYVEQKLATDVLPKLAKQLKQPDFREDVEHHLEETRRHVQNLERAFEILGERPTPEMNAAFDGLVAQHDKIVKQIQSDQLLDFFNAGAAAKNEHLEIAAYESLITTAGELDFDDVESLLEENLDDEKNTLKKIEKASKDMVKETARA